MKLSNQKILHEMLKLTPSGYITPDPDKEIVIRRGRGSLIEDYNGKQYIDLTSGVFTNTWGHCFGPLIAASLLQNMTLDNVHGRRTMAEYRLYRELSSFIGDSYRFIPYNDGGYTIDRGLSDIINYFHKERIPIGAFRGGFHGKTMGAKLTVNETQKATLFENFQMSYPYCYRCPLSLRRPDCKMACAKKVCEELEKQGARAVLFEPVQGSGIIIPPRGFWKQIEHYCKPRGILLFADEVLTGGGRTGYFSASRDYYGIDPDLIAFTKGLANGHPLSILCEKEAITENSYATRPGERYSTFAGHPEGLAIAAANLKCIRRYNLLNQVSASGRYLRHLLNHIKAENECVGDVRSIGLMGAIELVEDRTSKKTALALGERAFYLARKYGVEVINNGHILRIAPPLNIPPQMLARGLRVLSHSIRDAAK